MKDKSSGEIKIALLISGLSFLLLLIVALIASSCGESAQTDQTGTGDQKVEIVEGTAEGAQGGNKALADPSGTLTLVPSSGQDLSSQTAGTIHPISFSHTETPYEHSEANDPNEWRIPSVNIPQSQSSVIPTRPDYTVTGTDRLSSGKQNGQKDGIPTYPTTDIPSDTYVYPGGSAGAQGSQTGHTTTSGTAYPPAAQEEPTTETAIPPHEHIYGEWVVTQKPTCERNGVQTRVCMICGEKETKDGDPATGHAPVDSPAYPASCTTSGSTEGVRCSVCGKPISGCSVIPAAGHSYDEPAVRWALDNTAALFRECTVCRAQEYIPIEVTEEIVKEPTCTSPGAIVRTATIEIDGKTLSDSKTQTLDILPHSFSEPTFTWNGFTAEAERHCEKCGRIETLDVQMSDSLTKAPSCTQPGVRTFTARTDANGKICTDTKAETIGAVGHSYGDPVFTWRSHTASAERICSACKESDPLRASTYCAVTKEPTCSKTGLRTFTVCAALGKKIYADTKTQPIPQTGRHTYENRVCTVCGALDTEPDDSFPLITRAPDVSCVRLYPLTKPTVPSWAADTLPAENARADKKINDAVEIVKSETRLSQSRLHHRFPDPALCDKERAKFRRSHLTTDNPCKDTGGDSTMTDQVYGSIFVRHRSIF